MVGPRPAPLWMIQKMSNDVAQARFNHLPGMTGLTQVTGRHLERSGEQAGKLDMEYCQCCSFWVDCKILLKTIPVVLIGRGAC